MMASLTEYAGRARTGALGEEALRAAAAASLVELDELRDRVALLRAELSLRMAQNASLELRIVRLERELGREVVTYVESRYRFEMGGARGVRRTLALATDEVQRLMGWDFCELRAVGKSGREWSCYPRPGAVLGPEVPRIVRLPAKLLGAE